MMGTVSEEPLWKKLIEVRTQLRDINLEHWLHNNVFTLTWWLSLIIVILVFFLWWKLADKTRLLEITAYGLMVAITAIILDITGTGLILWGYPNMLLPFVPPLFAADLSILPVAYMLIYQYFSDWKPFAVAALVLALFLSFIVEPIAVWLEAYEMNNWKHIYSFPIYIVLALSLKWVMNKILAKQSLIKS